MAGGQALPRGDGKGQDAHSTGERPLV